MQFGTMYQSHSVARPRHAHARNRHRRNQNDEYHTPVSVVDVWMDYKRLADSKWTQQRIATAKKVSQQLVSFRIQCAKLPVKALEFFTNRSFLNERHAIEISRLLTVSNLTPWIDRDTLMLEILTEVNAKHKKSITAAS